MTLFIFNNCIFEEIVYQCRLFYKYAFISRVTKRKIILCIDINNLGIANYGASVYSPIVSLQLLYRATDNVVAAVAVYWADRRKKKLLTINVKQSKK